MGTRLDPKYPWRRRIACVAFMSLSLPVMAMDLYVQPAAKAGGTGTTQNPLAALEAARDVVRRSIATEMKEDITVHLGAGDYFIENPLEFDDRDSGRDGHTITYQGAPGLATRIHGGRRITGWKKINDQQVEAEVADLGQHFTLYENGKAANGGLFHLFPDAAAGDWRREGNRLIYNPRRFPIEGQVVVLGTAKDVFIIKGRSMKQIAGNLVFDGLCMIGSDFSPEWKAGATNYSTWDGEYDGRPWGGKSLGHAVLAPDMRHGQFFIENARKVIIRNSKLYGAGFMGVMFNRWAQENLVENCWVENAGCNGLFFMGWECGRGPFKTVAESYVNKKNVVRNNVFYDIGRFANDGAGLYMTFSGDNLVEHNVFRGMSRYGVATKGWRPGVINECYRYELLPDSQRNKKEEKPFDAVDVKLYDGYVVTEKNQGAELLHSRNNIIRFNDLSQIARDGNDMGMIEMWGAGTNNVWEYNACHDGVNNGGWDSWMHVLFNDDGSHQATVRGNVMYWVAGGDASRAIMSKGNNQNNTHNIIADCDLSSAFTMGAYVEPANDMTWVNNIVAAQIRRLHDIGGGVKEIGRNLYYYQPMGNGAGSQEDRERVKRQVEEAVKAGKIDRDSLYADPLFDRKHPWWDARYTDYRLKPESPALKLGFQQTDMSRIGLQKGYPFKLADIFAHPADETWKAGNFNRIYKGCAPRGILQPHSSHGMEKGAWVRYDQVNFGAGENKQFRVKAEFLTPQQTFETTSGGRNIQAVEERRYRAPIPCWEVSPAYSVNGKKGPELMDVAFAPETDPSPVKWRAVTEGLVSRATVRHPLGVINCDVANGENHANSAAYMRSSIYMQNALKIEVEIRGSYGMKVWLNGEKVFSQIGKIDLSPGVVINLKKGWNQFLVKVVQDDKDWAPVMQGYGNFWAMITMRYEGGTFIVPGLPGKELVVQPSTGTAIEVRLDAPDGKLIGELPFGQTTCQIQQTTGSHDVFLVFPNQNVTSMDWFRLE